MILRSLHKLGWVEDLSKRAWSEGWFLTRYHLETLADGTSRLGGAFVCAISYGPFEGRKDAYDHVLAKAGQGSALHMTALMIVFETSGDDGGYK